MRPAITMSVVGGVLLLSAALAYGGGHIEASTKFLLAWGKGNWDDLATVATEKVTVTVGGKDALIDIANKKAEVALVFPFRGISSVRVDGAVTGVTSRRSPSGSGARRRKAKARSPSRRRTASRSSPRSPSSSGERAPGAPASAGRRRRAGGTSVKVQRGRGSPTNRAAGVRELGERQFRLSARLVPTAHDEQGATAGGRRAP